MRTSPLLCFTLLVTFALHSAVGQAEDYQHPDGFRFPIPENWTVLDTQTVSHQSDFPDSVKNWLNQNPGVLDQVRVVVMANEVIDSPPNVNVVTVNQETPVNPQVIDELRTGIPEQYRSMGIQMDDFQIRIGEYRGRKVIVLNYLMSFAGTPTQLRQRQVHVPDHGKTFIITCTSSQAQFSNHEPVFESLLSGFETEPVDGAASTADFPVGEQAPAMMTWGIIAIGAIMMTFVLIAVGVFLAVMLMRKQSD